MTVKSGNTTIVSFTMPPYSYNNGTIVISAPNLTNGNSYTLYLGDTSTSVTAKNTIASGMGNGVPGGGRPF